MIKRIKKITAMLLAAACVLTAAGNAMADKAAAEVVTAGNSGEVTVENVLHIAKGTTVPDVTYTYKLEPCSLSSDVLTVAVPSSEANRTISYTKDSEIVNDTVSGSVVFDLSTDKVAYPSAGIYGFSISEECDYSSDKLTGVTDKKYYVLVYIKNSDDGLVIYGVTVQPYGSDDEEPGAKTAKALFEETYIDIDSDITTLTVDKTVKGDYADLTKTFDYKITFTNPSTVSNQTIQMVVEGSHGNSKEEQLSLTKAAPKGSLRFTLGNGDKATFTDIAAGTIYSVTETAVEGYTASYKQVVGGTEGETVDGTSVPETIIYDSGSNKVSYVNTYKDITVTGVVMNNAPFAAMIAVAVLAFASFVFIGFKRRKR